MEVDIGAKVVTLEGSDVGLVDRVVVEPGTNELVSIIVRSAFVPPRDIVVPVGDIERSSRHRVSLKLTTTDLKRMPDFIEDDYAPPPRLWVPPTIYPPAHVLVPLPGPADLGEPTFGERSRRPSVSRAPHYASAEDVTISEGTEVHCLDGLIGTVDEVITDPDTNRVASFVVRKSELFPKDVTVPVSLVSRVNQYRITLSCRKGELNNLPGGK